jgi:hypothetical protein
MTIANDHGDMATNENGNGFNGRVRALAVIALVFLVSWFAVCAMMRTDSSKYPRGVPIVIYKIPAKQTLPPKAPPR